MNQDDIIRMAREADLSVGTNISGVQLVGSPAEVGLAHLTIDELERFAALVAAAEREACAQVCEAGVHNAEDWDSSYWDQCCNNRAAAIRTRGNT